MGNSRKTKAAPKDGLTEKPDELQVLIKEFLAESAALLRHNAKIRRERAERRALKKGNRGKTKAAPKDGRTGLPDEFYVLVEEFLDTSAVTLRHNEWVRRREAQRHDKAFRTDEPRPSKYEIN
jgi:hypothetical protein